MTLIPLAAIGINPYLERIVRCHRQPTAGDAGGSPHPSLSGGPPTNSNEPPLLDYFGFCGCCDHPFVLARGR